jgi:hypothetical protein
MEHSFWYKFYHKVFPLLLLAVAILLWNISYCFNFHPPTGIYIAVIGCMVVLMTIWPPEEKWSKAFWLLVILIFTGLEIQSIYKDREEYDKQRIAIVKEEREGFRDILARFDTLIKRQEELFGRQEKLSRKTFEKVTEREGALIPNNLPNPTCRCSVPKNKETLYFAGGAATDMIFPFNVLSFHGKELISLDKDTKGFYITAKIFDDRGDLISNIERNKFSATYAASRIISTKSSLIVYDHKGDIAFFVRFTNKYSIEIKGNFYSPDGIKIEVDENKLTFNTNTFAGTCIYGGRGFMEIN